MNTEQTIEFLREELAALRRYARPIDPEHYRKHRKQLLDDLEAARAQEWQEMRDEMNSNYERSLGVKY